MPSWRSLRPLDTEWAAVTTLSTHRVPCPSHTQPTHPSTLRAHTSSSQDHFACTVQAKWSCNSQSRGWPQPKRGGKGEEKDPQELFPRDEYAFIEVPLACSPVMLAWSLFKQACGVFLFSFKKTI